MWRSPTSSSRGSSFTSWPLRTEGLTHSQPFLRYRDLEYYEDLQGVACVARRRHPFLHPGGDLQCASRARRRPARHQLAHMEPNGPALWVRKWYRVSRGGSGHPREVEFFRIHCLVIQNLAAELTRAVNLVLTRTREVDDGVAIPRRRWPLLTLVRPMRPVRAAGAVLRRGARTPPAVPGTSGISERHHVSRDIGAFGEVHEGRPRTPDDFVVWIDELLARLEGARPSRSPPTDTPPRSLPRPDGDAAAATPVPWWKHPLLAVAVAVLGVVGILLEPRRRSPGLRASPSARCLSRCRPIACWLSL